jgi:hypothetical protein
MFPARAPILLISKRSNSRRAASLPKRTCAPTPPREVRSVFAFDVPGEFASAGARVSTHESCLREEIEGDDVTDQHESPRSRYCSLHSSALELAQTSSTPTPAEFGSPMLDGLGIRDGVGTVYWVAANDPTLSAYLCASMYARSSAAARGQSADSSTKTPPMAITWPILLSLTTPT